MLKIYTEPDFTNYSALAQNLEVRRKAAIAQAGQEFPDDLCAFMVQLHRLVAAEGAPIHTEVYCEISVRAHNFDDAEIFSPEDRKILESMQAQYGEDLFVEVVKTENPLRRDFQVWCFHPDFFNSRIQRPVWLRPTDPYPKSFGSRRGEHFQVNPFGSPRTLAENLVSSFVGA